jgi:hypothetical protein
MMNLKVTISHTDSGAATTVYNESSNATKHYGSWADALSDGEKLGLLNKVEAVAAKVLPPGLPLHTSADVSLSSLLARGFETDQPHTPQA